MKVTVNLPKDLVKRLKDLSLRRNVSMTETIRKGLETALFLIKKEQSGSKILLAFIVCGVTFTVGVLLSKIITDQVSLLPIYFGGMLYAYFLQKMWK